MDKGWGIVGGEGASIDTRFSVVVGGGIVVGGAKGGWTDEGNLCYIRKFILKSTKSLKDMRTPKYSLSTIWFPFIQ